MAELPLPPLVLASTRDVTIIASGSTIHLSQSGSSSTTSTPAPSSSRSQHPNLIRALAISSDSTRAVSMTDAKTLLTYTISLSPLSITETSSRTITKKGSNLSFTPSGDILLSDKVGDVYLYPFQPLPISPEDRPPTVQLTSDPTLNPDAKLLLGHTSVLTSHILTPDNKHIITADRDEHIRISRYPQSYVVERYLFGSEGFVSVLHIPKSREGVLISGGGEDKVRIWDWRSGGQVGSVGIWEEVLPYRRVRTALRKDKMGAKRRKLMGDKAVVGSGEEVKGEGNIKSTEEGEVEKGFYDAPEGHVLPTGQGVCLKKMDSLDIEGETIVLFFSEGCAALHTFILPQSFDTSSDTISIKSFQTEHPILDFTPLPTHSNQFLVSLDTSFGTLTKNQTGWGSGKRELPELSDEDVSRLNKSLIIVEVAKGGIITDTSSQHTTFLDSIYTSLSQPHLLETPSTLSTLSLHQNLSLLPRWPGQEEDDEDANANTNLPAPDDVASQAGTVGASLNRVYSREELEGLGLKELGRLRARGIDVDEFISKKRKLGKAKPGKNAREAKRRELEKVQGREEEQVEEEDIVNGSEAV